MYLSVFYKHDLVSLTFDMYLYLRDDVCKNCTCECTISESISDRAHSLAMDSQSVYKTFLEDNQVGITCGHVR
jgi:hypothetical protein